MSADMLQARRARPLSRVIEEEGRSKTACPVCQAPAEIERSGRYSAAFIERVRETTDILAVAERVFGHAALKKQGSNFVTLCPVHAEKSPSFNVVPGKRMFHCFGCKIGGSVFELLKITENKDFPTAVRELATAAGVPEEFEDEFQRLRCSSSACDAHQRPLDEVGWLSAVRGLNRQEAFVAYLQESGQRTGELHSPSLMLKGRRKGRLPKPEDDRPRVDPDHPQPIEADAPSAVASIAGPPSDQPVLGTTPPSLATNRDNRDDDPAEPKKPAAVVNQQLVRRALARFFESLVLDRSDAVALWQKRGLEPMTLRAAGIRSNRPENIDALNALADEFPVEVLLRAGLWERNWNGDEESSDASEVTTPWGPITRRVVDGCSPSRFYVGLGVGGQSRVNGVKKVQYDWNRAPLIPYFDWTPRTPASLYDRACVTEGELKALAWWQWAADARDAAKLPEPDPSTLLAIRTHKHWAAGATAQAFLTPSGGARMRWMGRRIRLGFAAVPGISFVRRRAATTMVRDQIDLWIKRTGAEDVVVCFDNEEKGDPNLRGYNPNVEERHDAVAWGLFLARDIWSMGVRGRFMSLPDSERNVDGKADWDGVLASKVHAPAGGESEGDR